MPINNITQTISTLPPAGKRGVDVQTAFVTKQEDFQDHLQGTTVNELNTLKDQLNSRIGEINSTTTTMNGYANTASAGASTATTKAGEASISASDALAYKNQAETFKNNASASAIKASQWADNNYNVEVESGKYSAKHWSTVAQNTVNNKINKVTSTDNAVVRFDGVTGEVQNSSILIDDVGNLNITGTGKRIIGDFSNSTVANRVAFQTSTLNGSTSISIYPNGTSQVSIINAYSTTDPMNSSLAQIGIVGGENLRIHSGVNGTGTPLPISFATGGAERMRIDTAGNVLVNGSGGLGYGTGSGGTVTQLTSKSTAVTLNKPSGVINMNNADLAAGASVLFPFYNSTCDSNYDQLIVNMHSVGSGYNNYKVENAGTVGGGGNYIRLTNISGISLSESPSIKFTVIKGATS